MLSFFFGRTVYHAAFEKQSNMEMGIKHWRMITINLVRGGGSHWRRPFSFSRCSCPQVPPRLTVSTYFSSLFSCCLLGLQSFALDSLILKPELPHCLLFYFFSCPPLHNKLSKPSWGAVQRWGGYTGCYSAELLEVSGSQPTKRRNRNTMLRGSGTLRGRKEDKGRGRGDGAGNGEYQSPLHCFTWWSPPLKGQLLCNSPGLTRWFLTVLSEMVAQEWNQSSGETQSSLHWSEGSRGTHKFVRA